MCKQLHINLIEENNNEIIIQFVNDFWEQKVPVLLNKITEFIDEQSINYRIEEFKKSLLLKLKIKKEHDRIDLINKIMNKLQIEN